MTYDPLQAPDPHQWLAMDEERIMAIERYHKREPTRLRNLMVQASIHSVVENQVAMGDQYEAAAALRRLLDEGLDRYEAVHAIGSVVAAELCEALKHPPESGDPAASYLTKVRQITATKWRSMETK